MLNLNLHNIIQTLNGIRILIKVLLNIYIKYGEIDKEDL